jgi:hypothetical protein
LSLDEGIDYSAEVRHALNVRAALSVRQQVYRSLGTRGFLQYMARRQKGAFTASLLAQHRDNANMVSKKATSRVARHFGK